MNMQQTSLSGLFGRWVLVLLLAPVVALAQDKVHSCDLATLETVFKNNVRIVDETPVDEIQDRLNSLCFGSLNVDGFMGKQTRKALQKFCRSQGEGESAESLVQLLLQPDQKGICKLSPTSPTGTAKELSGPAVYYRWTAPEPPAEDAAPTTDGADSAKPAQEVCQGSASPVLPPSPATTVAAVPVTVAVPPAAQETAAPIPVTAPAPAAKQEAAVSAPLETGGSVDPATGGESSAAAPIEADGNPATGAEGENGKPSTQGDEAPAASTVQPPPPQTSVNQPATLPPAVSMGDAKSATQAPRECPPPTVKEIPKPKEDNTLPAEATNRLALIEGIAYPNQTLFEQALAVLFKDSDMDSRKYQKYQKLILDQARQGPITPAAMQVTGADCGCSRDLSSLVYGFYPYWLATAEQAKNAQPDQVQGEQQQDGQKIDFSLLDRIAFYALSLDRQGDIQLQDTGNWQSWGKVVNMRGFIRQAHKYRVAVDLAVYAADWQDWSEQVMEHAAYAVVKAASEKFSADLNLLSWQVPLLSENSTSQVDGVTLVFEDYGRHTKEADKIVTFVRKLKERLGVAGQDLKINIMLGMDANALVAQASLFSELKDILIKQDDTAPAVEYILVFLPEPTTDSKKALRRKVEDEFHGADRQIVLRKIVAVISPFRNTKATTSSEAAEPLASNDPVRDQFADDLIYFQDNFIGVGLWPLPLESDAEMERIRTTIIERLKLEDDANHLGDMINSLPIDLCQYACPNRWLFRLSFDLLAGFLLLYAVLAFWICRLRVLYRQYFIYFLGLALVTLLIMLISLACDPFWKEKADIVVASVALVLGSLALWKTISKMARPPLP